METKSSAKIHTSMFSDLTVYMEFRLKNTGYIIACMVYIVLLFICKIYNVDVYINIVLFAWQLFIY